jgi:archaellum component FlaC
MSETPICDKHKYETDQGAEVVPFEIAQKLERKLKNAEKDSDRAEADEFWVIIEAAFADKDRQINKAYDYAANLLTGIVNEHYKPVEGFGPLPRPDVVGVLAQIDNAYTGVSDQLAESRAEVERLRARNAELKKQLSDIEEREAACCPEYVSFDALIAALRKQVLRLERKNAELKQKAETIENLLLIIQAWDIDKHELRGHQCLAKQWICSFQDRINRYKRGKKRVVCREQTRPCNKSTSSSLGARTPSCGRWRQKGGE